MANPANPDSSFRILDKDTVGEYLAGIPVVAELLGTQTELSVLEIGDGNLNFVYKVSNLQVPPTSVIVKQAVPYLRLAGESWPLARDRMRYEIRAFAVYSDLVPNFVPQIFHADEDMSTVVMRFLDDHTILRTGMMNGTRYPDVGKHIGEFLAEALFKTSTWSMGSVERRNLLDKFNLNSDLCKLTEDFVFTFPYIEHDSNYSNAKTDAWVKDNIHTDYQYKSGVLALKQLFLCKSEALLHGDLHTGSMMVNQTETYVIDTEFAFFGPISFDLGKIMSNFLLSCTSHFHRSGGADYRQWILEQIPVIWNVFQSRFIDLWEQAGESAMYSNGFLSAQEQSQFRDEFMVNVLQEAIGFTACSLARRTIGIAGVADIRDIEDLDIRASLEILNLKLSKRLMADHKNITSIDELLVLVHQLYSESRP